MNSIIATLPEIIPNLYVIPSNSCQGTPDHLHFKAGGYEVSGKRYAIKMSYDVAETE